MKALHNQLTERLTHIPYTEWSVKRLKEFMAGEVKLARLIYNERKSMQDRLKKVKIDIPMGMGTITYLTNR